MWVKVFEDRSVLYEDRKNGRTWCNTDSNQIRTLYMICDGQQSPHLSGMGQYWHSRSIRRTVDDGYLVCAERIQGRLPNGSWLTITWDGHRFTRSVEPRPIGRPVRT